MQAMVEVHGDVATEQFTGAYDRQCWENDEHQAGGNYRMPLSNYRTTADFGSLGCPSCRTAGPVPPRILQDRVQVHLHRRAHLIHARLDLFGFGLRGARYIAAVVGYGLGGRGEAGRGNLDGEVDSYVDEIGSSKYMTDELQSNS
jgi:hypothetical protein